MVGCGNQKAGGFWLGAEVILGLSNLYLTEKNQSGTTKN
jgi:hypothetical protein